MATAVNPVNYQIESMPQPFPELQSIAESLKRGEPSPRVTVRQLLTWFGAQRRGYYVVISIRLALDSLGLKTNPDFEGLWIDAEIQFLLVSQATEPENLEAGTTPQTQEVDSAPAEAPPPVSTLVGGAVVDPTYRIGKLDAANKKVLSVAPNQTVEQAITLMLVNGFSQLPVMQGDRDIKGIVSWESVGARLALGGACQEVRECMLAAQIIGSDKSLFAAIELIADHQYVLVQAADRRITGIVTSADLSRQFHQLSEPFLLLGEIEQHIRALIVDKFTLDQLRQACDPADSTRAIQSVADLTMGEYIRLLENPAHWGRIGIRIDRAAFVEQLQVVRRIRNEVMHFDPDPLADDDLKSLQRFVVFMRSLRDFGAIK